MEIEAGHEINLDFQDLTLAEMLDAVEVSRVDLAAAITMNDAVFSTTFFRIVAGLLTAMLISAIGIYLFERKHHRDQFDKGWVKGVAAGMWWAAVTLTTVGCGDKVPRTLSGRLIGLIWMFAGLFILARSWSRLPFGHPRSPFAPRKLRSLALSRSERRPWLLWDLAAECGGISALRLSVGSFAVVSRCRVGLAAHLAFASPPKFACH